MLLAYFTFIWISIALGFVLDSNSTCANFMSSVVGCSFSNSDSTKLRSHLNKHPFATVQCDESWLSVVDTKICTNCTQYFISTSREFCVSCARDLKGKLKAPPIPRHEHLPNVDPKPKHSELHVPLRKKVNLVFPSKVRPPSTVHVPPAELNVHSHPDFRATVVNPQPSFAKIDDSIFDQDLLLLSRLNVQLMHRIPISEVNFFASTWSSLLNEAKSVNTSASWFEVLRFPTAILIKPPRAGKRISKNLSWGVLVHKRIIMWKDVVVGRPSLWANVISENRRKLRKPKSSVPSTPVADLEKLEKKVVALLHAGDTKKAIQQLIAAPIAPNTPQTFKALQALHPAAPPIEPRVNASLGPSDVSPIFSKELVKRSLASFGPSSAGGLFHYKPSILVQCFKADSFHFGTTLTSIVNFLASGSAPDFLKPFLGGGSSVALQKNDNGIRPLCSGDPIRRLVAKCFCLGGKDDINDTFKNRNFGVGCPGGVELIAHSLRSSLLQLKSSGKGLLKIDFKNAFNLVDRQAFMSEADRLFPAMSRWTHWCYDKPTILMYEKSSILMSSCGTQQGDPLGPLYFCCPLLWLITEIDKFGVDYNKWYMDDGGIIADVETLSKVWELLVNKGPAFGLYLNSSKCEFSWLDKDDLRPCPIGPPKPAFTAPGAPDLSIKLVPTSNIEMLGVPLGSDTFGTDYVSRKLLKAKDVMSKITQFNDTQSAFYLLRTSYSITRANHFMRTTPLAIWFQQAQEYDALVRGSAEEVLGFPFSDREYKQAATSPNVGGLGLRQCSIHAPGAFNDSLWRSQKFFGDKWPDKDRSTLKEAPPQRERSMAIDEKTIAELMSTADKRGAHILQGLQSPHASAWVTAPPSIPNGFENVIQPRAFQISAMRLLNHPISCSPTLCAICKQSNDIYGDHAVCCKLGGDIITRHNRLRDVVAAVAEEGGLNPILEKKGILGHTDKSQRRPADVAIPTWSMGKGLAIDVAVISATAPTNLKVLDPVEVYGLNVKHGNYDAAFVGTPWFFCAMIWESSGGLNVEGTNALRQLFKFAAKRSGSRLCVYSAVAWRRVSCALQSAVAQCILNRLSTSDSVCSVSV